MKEPYLAHSDLTGTIYIVVGQNKYNVTEQAIKAVMAIKASELEQETILDDVRNETVLDIKGKIHYYALYGDEYVNSYLCSIRQVLAAIDKRKAESIDKRKEGAKN